MPRCKISWCFGDGRLPPGECVSGRHGRARNRSGLPVEQEIGELMELVGRIKGGYQGDTVASKMAGIANALVGRGAQAVIAGCTEIPLVLNSAMLDVPLISSTDVLAEKTAAIACGELPLPCRE